VDNYEKAQGFTYMIVCACSKQRRKANLIFLVMEGMELLKRLPRHRDGIFAAHLRYGIAFPNVFYFTEVVVDVF
jgi:hypothetical protein